MKRPLRINDPLLAAALAAVAMTGCHSTMTSAHDPSPAGSEAVPPNMVPPHAHGPFTGTVADWPLWFVRHESGVSTSSPYGGRVVSNNFVFLDRKTRGEGKGVLVRVYLGGCGSIKKNKAQ